jgi:hypothetical protein
VASFCERRSGRGPIGATRFSASILQERYFRAMIKDMTGASLRALCVLLGLLGLGGVARAQTFSADLITRNVGVQPGGQGRVYVSGGKVRIETPGFADGFFIVDVDDGDRGAAWFVRPRQWLVMDAKQSSPLTQLLVRVDPKDPCRRWQVMERIAGVTSGAGEWRCQLLGGDIVDGRETVKYEVISRQNRRSSRWIDPQREFLVKLEAEDGTMVALEHIVDAPQPSNLFAVPRDYRKFDPMQLIDQIKQSDVWVEPPR